MSGLVAAVKAEVDDSCLMENVDKLKANRCSIDLTEAPNPHLIVNFDDKESPLGNSDTRPDFLLISDTGGVSNKGERGDPGLIAPVEMSTGRSKNASKIKDQLQAGVNWLDNVPDGFQPTLLPVYCGRPDKSTKMDLGKKKSMVRFRGEEELPRIIIWNKKKKPPKFPEYSE